MCNGMRVCHLMMWSHLKCNSVLSFRIANYSSMKSIRMKKSDYNIKQQSWVHNFPKVFLLRALHCQILFCGMACFLSSTSHRILAESTIQLLTVSVRFMWFTWEPPEKSIHCEKLSVLLCFFACGNWIESVFIQCFELKCSFCALFISKKSSFPRQRKQFHKLICTFHITQAYYMALRSFSSRNNHYLQ